MLTVAYVVALPPIEGAYEVPGSTDRPCADCGDMLRVAPSTVGILERHPAALLLCTSCALVRKIKDHYHLGLTTSQMQELKLYFRHN